MKNQKTHIITLTILIIMAIITSILKVHAGGYSIPTTPYHTLQQIVKSQSDPTPIDDDGDGYIDKEAIENPNFNGLDYAVIVGYRGEVIKIKWKNNDAIALEDVAEKYTLSNTEIANLPTQFQSYTTGIRCKNENGWYLVGCTAIGDIESTQPHIIYKNGCFAEKIAGTTAACIKFK